MCVTMCDVSVLTPPRPPSQVLCQLGDLVCDRSVNLFPGRAWECARGERRDIGRRCRWRCGASAADVGASRVLNSFPDGG